MKARLSILALSVLPGLGCQVLPSAHGEPPIVLDLDTAAPEAAPLGDRPWPVETRVDTQSSQIRLTWTEGEVGAEPETIALDQILQFEHARNFDLHPEELFLHLVGGRRILISRGDQVKTDLTQIRAWVDRPVVELPSGQGHLEWSGQTDLAPPRLIIETQSGAFQIQTLDEEAVPTETAMEPTVSGTHRSAKTTGSGTIRRENIDHTIKTHMSRFRGCYQRQLQRRPGLEGTVVMEITIGSDGSTRSAEMVQTSLHDPAVETRLSTELKRLRFEAPRSGEVIIRYPFSFTTS